ncbi:sulfite reductase subunit A [Roseiconus nitratireducens]|uniref:Sulfite reductase subunit A n=1 Tax=Roseiconus nitratireducens TaxID=2605748 RepID=A0A5M6DHR2_9BACT|nr:4Fe-4S dicluster domain-containing protein [Roseiconus nitratireducens]KAA5547084.1 sulfite reductase subunit A [Roseiconus nitratireducens]
MSQASTTETSWLPRDQFQRLIDVLQNDGYEVIGPVVRNAAIVYDRIDSVDQLPAGWSDRQQPATYRIEPTGHSRWFHFNAGPDSWKKFLFPSRQSLGGARLTNDGWQFESPPSEPEVKYAFLGVRACDLAAIKIQDRVFLSDQFTDPVYARLRQSALIIAVECSTAAPTCFCTSMDTGPECGGGFDLALTETETGFCVRSGSQAGTELVAALRLQPADDASQQQASQQTAAVRQSVTKQLDTQDIHDLLLDHLEHPRWDDVAQRCLSCANCTLVCPTCFCSTVEEVSDLDRTDVSRIRQWDSCFNPEFGYTASGTVRQSTRSRYRQWLTHKLATWHDQFGTSGCVGCGRCITWCPVGIDLVEEVAAIRHSVQGAGGDDASN